MAPLSVGCSVPTGPSAKIGGVPSLGGPTQVPGFVRELRTIEATLDDGSHVAFDALVTRPFAAARFPLVLLTHGSPRDASQRSGMSPTLYGAQSLALARRGYAAVVLMRRGFGTTAGPLRENVGACEDRDYLRAARISAGDLLGALRPLRKEPWVDPDRIVLMGQSAGGLAALAAASSNPAGVVAVVSFAGGRGSDRPDHVCQPERLLAAVAALGRTSRVPGIWIYRENDRYFSPELARSMAKAYQDGGAPLKFVLDPPFGEDGHSFFSKAPTDAWWSILAPFLQSLRLPTDSMGDKASARVSPPPGLGEGGRAAFLRYLESEAFEKAFAVHGSAWGSSSGKRTQEEANAAALESCEEYASHDCSLYAAGNRLAR